MTDEQYESNEFSRINETKSRNKTNNILKKETTIDNDNLKVCTGKRMMAAPSGLNISSKVGILIFNFKKQIFNNVTNIQQTPARNS